MLEDERLKKLYYHLLLLNKNRIKIGTQIANQEFRETLLRLGSLENTFNLLVQELLPDTNLENKLSALTTSFEITTINDETYPRRLKLIPTISPIIYTQGNLSLLNTKTIAVVGTRDLTKEQDINAEIEILQRLIKKDYTIVSGLARGCDTLAHEKTIELGGKTIAVLGTPLNIFYPYENQSLQEKIAKDHLVVTEYPFTIKTFPSYFAHRNHLMVSLCNAGIVVVRADDHSGTQHAIRTAFEQNKSIYVLENNFNKGYKWIVRYKKNIIKVRYRDGSLA